MTSPTAGERKPLHALRVGADLIGPAGLEFDVPNDPIRTFASSTATLAVIPGAWWPSVSATSRPSTTSLSNGSGAARAGLPRGAPSVPRRDCSHGLNQFRWAIDYGAARARQLAHQRGSRIRLAAGHNSDPFVLLDTEQLTLPSSLHILVGVNLSRLMILGLLAERGPMHGHQIRRLGELTNAAVWGGITGGALYAELRRLERDELVRPLRHEQVGKRPARTIFEITDEGRLELAVQRDQALESLHDAADPVSVVLLFAAGADPDDLHQRLAGRRFKVQAQLDAMVRERTLLASQGVLSPMALAAFRRGELRLEAELRWHEEFSAQPPAARQRRGSVRTLRSAHRSDLEERSDGSA